MAQGKDWSAEFGTGDLAMESEWTSGKSTNSNTTIFGKIVLVTRLCSLLGAIFTLFLRNKSRERMTRNQQPQIEMSNITAPEVTEAQAEVQFEGVKSLYDEVKLISNEQQQVEEQVDMMVQAFAEEEDDEDMDRELRRIDKVAEKLEEEGDKVVEEAAIEQAQDTQAIDADTEIITVAEVEKESEIVASDAMKALDEVIQVKEVGDMSVITPTEQIPVIVKEDKEAEKIEVKTETENILATPQESIPVQIVEEPTNTNKIISEDFWKAKEVPVPTVEETKKEEKKPEETKAKPFELPSVLQSLREKPAAANKPWLTRKKKVVVEESAPVETIAQPVVVAETISQPAVLAETIAQPVIVNEMKPLHENITEVKVDENATPGNMGLVAVEDLINSAAAVNDTQVTV